MRRAQQRAEVAAEKAEREREIEEAQIHATGGGRARAHPARTRDQRGEHLARAGAGEARDPAQTVPRGRGAEPRRRDRGERGGEPHPARPRRRRRASAGATRSSRRRSSPCRRRTLEAELRSLTIRKQSEFARLEQERDVEQRRALQRAEVEFEKLEREREVDEANVKAKEAVERARIKADLAVEAEQIQRAQETERLEIQRQRTARDRGAGAPDRHRRRRSASRRETQIETEAARTRLAEAQEGVVSAREKEIAERRKMIDLIEARAAGGSQHDQGHRPSGSGEEGGGRARRGREGLGGSVAPSLRGGGRGAAQAQRGGEPALRRVASHRAQPQAVRAICRDHPRERQADGADRVDQDHAGRGLARFQQRAPAADGRRRLGAGDGAGGGDGRPGNLAESVVNAAMRYRSQIPFVDNLLKEVGMSPNNLSDLSDLNVRLEKPPAK